MKKSAGLISFLIIILFMTFTIPADAEKGEVQKITGQLVKASIRHLAVYVKHDSRIVQFRTTKEVCERFKPKQWSYVEVAYNISESKALNLVAIKIVKDYYVMLPGEKLVTSLNDL